MSCYWQPHDCGKSSDKSFIGERIPDEHIHVTTDVSTGIPSPAPPTSLNQYFDQVEIDKCGNGQIDDGEECDDNTDTCVECLLQILASGNASGDGLWYIGARVGPIDAGDPMANFFGWRVNMVQGSP